MQLHYITDTLDLTDSNFLLYAAKHYDNSQCADIEEFYEDLLRPIHLKKLFTRYHVNSDLKERLILNHVICMFNMFEPLAACKILFFKMDEKYYSYLKTVLHFLNRVPDFILIDGEILDLKNIEIDTILLQRLNTYE